MPVAKEINQHVDYCINSIAIIYHRQEKLDSALIKYKEVLELSRSQNNVLAVAATSNNIGRIYKNKKEFEEAQKYLNEALQISKENNYVAGTIGALQEFSELMYMKGDLDAALSYSLQALDLLSNTNHPDYLSTIYKDLRKIYTQKGNYKEALRYMEKSTVLKDSLFNIEKSQQIEELSTKYEVKQKDLANQQLKAEAQQRSILGIAGIILAALMAAIAILQKRANDFKKRQNEILEKRVVERTKELSKTNEQLAEVKHIQLLEEAKTRFFANVSHEFRTPLTLIQGPLSTLHNNGRLNDKDNRMIQRALHNTQQLSRLVNQVLDLTKFDSSQLSLTENAEVFYLLIRRLAANFETYAQSKNITLSNV